MRGADRWGNHNVSPLRILQVSESILPGGTLNVFTRRALGLARRGHEVRAVLPDVPGIDDIVGRLRTQGLRVDRGPLGNLSPRSAWQTLSASLAQGPVDVAILDLPTLTSSRLLPFMLRRLGVQRIVAVVHLPVFSTDRGWRRALDSTTKSFNFSRCDRIVAVSKAAAEDVRSIYAGSSSVPQIDAILNGVDPFPRASRQANRRVDSCRILAVGMLNEQKDHATLLKAIEVAVHQYPRLTLTIVGEGPLRADLERQRAELGLSGIVSMPGFVRDLGKELRAADLVVCSSRVEGCPLAVLEAATEGIPVVVSSAAANLEIVRDGETGLVFEVGDSTALATAICRLLADPKLRRRLGRGGLIDARKRYRAERMIDDYEELCVGLALPRSKHLARGSL